MCRPRGIPEGRQRDGLDRVCEDPTPSLKSRPRGTQGEGRPGRAGQAQPMLSKGYAHGQGPIKAPPGLGLTPSSSRDADSGQELVGSCS